MNKLTFIIILCFSLGSISIEAKSEMTKNEAVEHLCVTVRLLARLSMTHRQKGTTLKDVINMSQSKPFYFIQKPMLLEVYDDRLQLLDSSKQRAVNEYENKHYLKCIKGEAKDYLPEKK